MGKTRAQLARAVKQDALREYLSKQGLVQHVVELARKIEDPDTESEMVNRFKLSAEIRLKLVNKYLPDMKFVESEGTIDMSAQVTEVKETIVDPEHPDSEGV